MYSLSFGVAAETMGKSVIRVFDITYKYFSIYFFLYIIFFIFRSIEERLLMTVKPNCYHFELLL
jgi:hypothetical protein